MKDPTTNMMVGAFGLLRILIPKILSMDILETTIIHRVIEVYELCLHLLNESNHTIINASLECLCAILSNSGSKLNGYLFSDDAKHMEVLGKKRSLKHQMFGRKGAGTMLEECKLNIQTSTPEKKRNDSTTHEMIADASAIHDDKALLTCSDIETDCSNLNESESEKNHGSPSFIQLSMRNDSNTNTSVGLKSADTFGSFFNTILTHSNTGTDFDHHSSIICHFFRHSKKNIYKFFPFEIRIDVEIFPRWIRKSAN